jgi:hypothetical protein
MGPKSKDGSVSTPFAALTTLNANGFIFRSRLPQKNAGLAPGRGEWVMGSIQKSYDIENRT